MIIAAIILLVVCLIWYIRPPKEINSFFGYRTPNSKKSLRNWEVANKYSSKLFLLLTIILLVEALFLTLYFSEKYEPIIFSTFLLGTLVIILLTELKLKKLS